MIVIMRTWLASLTLLVVLGPAWAKSPINRNPLTIREAIWTVPPQAPKTSGALEIRVDLAPPHHAYVDQFKVEILEPEGATFSLQSVSPAITFFDKFSKRERTGIKDRGSVLGVVDLPAGLPESVHEIKGQLTYQACTEDYCLLPKKVAFAVAFSGPEKSPRESDGSGEVILSAFGSRAWLEAQLAKGWLWALLLIFAAGIATSFTPCVFPMIPITLAVLGARGGSRTRRGRLLLSLTYVLGIALTYAILGLIAALTGSLFGSFLGQTWVSALLGAAFMAFGFSLFGAFELQLPLQLTQRLSLHKTQGGFLGAFMAGNLAGLVASPCVGPVLAAILAYVAKTQDPWRGFALLFVFGFGLGQLFLLLGTFSQAQKWLPRSGPWLESVKYLLGLSMHALALFYLQPIVADHAWAPVLGLWLLGLFLYFWFKKDALKWEALGRLSLIVILALAVLLLALPQFFASPAGTKNEEVQPGAMATLPWQTFSDELLATAKSQGRPVVIDFWAEWCVACKELEVKTFSSPEIQALKDQVLWLKFDATKETPEFRQLAERYEIFGLPHLVFYDHQGKVRPDLTLTGFEDAANFKSRLSQALSK